MRALTKRAASRVAERGAERGVWDVEGTATEVELPPQRLER